MKKTIITIFCSFCLALGIFYPSLSATAASIDNYVQKNAKKESVELISQENNTKNDSYFTAKSMVQTNDSIC